MNSSNFLISLILFYFCGSRNEVSGNDGQKFTQILNDIQKGYDKRVRPNYGESPTSIGVTLYVLSLPHLGENDMEFTMDMYFRQTWNDPRLKYTGLNQITLDYPSGQVFWQPDTFFVNEKNRKVYPGQEFFKISPEGDVLKSFRVTVTASCPMDLQFFPMDTQQCNLEIESFGYTMQDIRYKWDKGLNSVGISADVSLPEFKILGHKQQLYELQLSTGNYSRLVVGFLFERSSGYYLTSVYFPAALIVILSWIAFWINRSSVGIRIAVGILEVFGIVLISLSLNNGLPKISYLKAIDMYLLPCFIMVVLAVLESATVGYIGKDRKTDSNGELSEESENARIEAAIANRKSKGIRTTFNLYRSKSCSALIDKISRIISPIIFICFNVAYMIVYKHVTTFQQEYTPIA